jgi:catechol 2,3-dioxygenase-like lactoylglutathione lyase family enzyme
MADVFDHVTVRVSDIEASHRFYELALAQLGYGVDAGAAVVSPPGQVEGLSEPG